MLLRLVEDIKEERFGSLEGGGLLGWVEEVGEVLKDTADQELKDIHNIAWLHTRLRCVLEAVDVLLTVPVVFPQFWVDYQRCCLPARDRCDILGAWQTT
jgi:hypothetical protein